MVERRGPGELEAAVLATLWAHAAPAAAEAPTAAAALTAAAAPTAAEPADPGSAGPAPAVPGPERDAGLIPAQVQAALERGGQPLAYTSVLTTLRRLLAKGQVVREPRGRAFAYRPTASAAQAAADHMRALLGQGPGRQLVLSSFVATLSPEEEQLLARALADVGRGQDGP
jgi:predicted transcriptional regulator